jgi:hypothetical protein
MVATYLPRKLATFVNRGTLNGGFAGKTVTFDNEAALASPT